MWADVRSERQGLVGWAGWLRSGRVRRCYGSSDMGLAVSVGSGETGVVRGGVEPMSCWSAMTPTGCWWCGVRR